MTNDYSELSSSGFTHTSIVLHLAAKVIVNNARALFKNNKIYAHIYSYREQDYEHLACDLFIKKDQHQTMPITICAAKKSFFDCWDEPDVIDMTEAVHLVGIITTALSATIICGLHRNEVNHAVLDQPLKGNETNGKMDLFT